jgi:hypothetical protein
MNSIFDNFHTISNADYHADKTTIGHSSLVKMLRSPAHFAEYVRGQFEPTPAMAIGIAVHAAILEPLVFVTTYTVISEDAFAGTLQSMDDYKAAADVLGIPYGVPGKDELKAALKAADNFHLAFYDDMAAEMAALTQEKLVGTLQSLDDYKTAAIALGIETKLKKDELKAAIKAADVNSEYRFKEDVVAQMESMTKTMLEGTLRSLDDYKAAAVSFGGVRTEALTKDELKAAIKAADVNSQFRFKEDVYASLYGDKIILSEDQMEAVAKMRFNANLHKSARQALSLGKAELSAFWTDPDTGIKCKCRPDFLMSNGETLTGILDVKSTLDASSSGFSRSIGKFGYDIQAAFYIDGVKAVTGLELPFFYLAAEKTAPHAVAMYRASDAMVETGRKKYRAALELLQWCRETGQYPAYQPFGDIETIELSKWDSSFDDEE